jgi:uncharacterized protein YggU (UPF0235/DUF167 family)
MVRPKPSLPPASSILALADAHGRVAIRVSPGAFSDAVLRLLAKALDRPVSALELVRGVRTRTKLVRILR